MSANNMPVLQEAASRLKQQREELVMQGQDPKTHMWTRVGKSIVENGEDPIIFCESSIEAQMILAMWASLKHVIKLLEEAAEGYRAFQVHAFRSNESNEFARGLPNHELVDGNKLGNERYKREIKMAKDIIRSFQDA